MLPARSTQLPTVEREGEQDDEVLAAVGQLVCFRVFLLRWASSARRRATCPSERSPEKHSCTWPALTFIPLVLAPSHARSPDTHTHSLCTHSHSLLPPSPPSQVRHLPRASRTHTPSRVHKPPPLLAARRAQPCARTVGLTLAVFCRLHRRPPGKRRPRRSRRPLARQACRNVAHLVVILPERDLWHGHDPVPVHLRR